MVLPGRSRKRDAERQALHDPLHAACFASLSAMVCSSPNPTDTPAIGRPSPSVASMIVPDTKMLVIGYESGIPDVARTLFNTMWTSKGRLGFELTYVDPEGHRASFEKSTVVLLKGRER